MAGPPRWLARLFGWRRVTQQGVILYVMDGPCRVPWRTTALGLVWGWAITKCTQNTVMSYVTLGKAWPCILVFLCCGALTSQYDAVCVYIYHAGRLWKCYSSSCDITIMRFAYGRQINILSFFLSIPMPSLCMDPQITFKRHAYWPACVAWGGGGGLRPGRNKMFCTRPIRAAKTGRKSLVQARRVKRTNHGRTQDPCQMYSMSPHLPRFQTPVRAPTFPFSLKGT